MMILFSNRLSDRVRKLYAKNSPDGCYSKRKVSEKQKKTKRTFNSSSFNNLWLPWIDADSSKNAEYAKN